MSQLTPPPLVVVMGISGVGKSEIGHKLAERLDVPYEDGDAFHSESNVAKMSAGTPLTDEDRWPWLQAIGVWLHEHDSRGAVVSCSALRRAYRDVIVDSAPRATFLHLAGDHALIRERMERRDHFMPVSLLQSQEDTLEPLQPDENGEVLDIAPPPAEIVDTFLGRVEAVQAQERRL
ncbi:gluconokinase [Mumia sp. zg.B53]|uniref:gluconokinase n=1 Tax=unclassified Mumia TaxID=2621872 RepID=UPI001C6E1FEC|nr:MULTISPECIES: gluconokinase [unclassified Mumia]MBW9205543.1 gluconokinase [Mumia sp. zg.B17]MBW9208456.1 gluconokinase [Mumia sp. zg.B21]MBW9216413.1 gluconokinase [Mumia sp. zg.B53]MDD9347760.1 gluconokinase [Mumia sp.]